MSKAKKSPASWLVDAHAYSKRSKSKKYSPIIPAQPFSSALLITSDENLIVQDVEIVQIIAWRITNGVAYPILAFEVDASYQDILPFDENTDRIIHPIHGTFNCIREVLDYIYMGVGEEVKVIYER